jgi:peptide/nickel transport system permease protein
VGVAAASFITGAGKLGRLRTPSALHLAAGFLALTVVGALGAPLFVRYAPSASVGRPFEQPSLQHLLGLNDVGQDVLSNLLYGARTSLAVGVSAAVVTLLIGGVVGIVAGYLGGVIDAALQILMDFALVVPRIPLLIVIASVFSASEIGVVLVIGVLSWPFMARVLRSHVRGLRERLYVERAEALGGRKVYIMRAHILPHAASIILAMTVLALADAIFLETALAFLGLGPAVEVSWGGMIQDAFQHGAASAAAWWDILPPGLAVGAVILCCNEIATNIESRLNAKLHINHVAGGALGR